MKLKQKKRNIVTLAFIAEVFTNMTSPVVIMFGDHF